MFTCNEPFLGANEGFPNEIWNIVGNHDTENITTSNSSNQLATNRGAMCKNCKKCLDNSDTLSLGFIDLRCCMSISGSYARVSSTYPSIHPSINPFFRPLLIDASIYPTFKSSTYVPSFYPSESILRMTIYDRI